MPRKTPKRATWQLRAPDFRSAALIEFYEETSKGPGAKRAKLHLAMLKMIENALWNPGDRLPTDREFTEKLPLSLATVQASLQMLAEQGVIVRKKRNGSFVASEDHLSRDHVFFCFVDSDSNLPLKVEDCSLDVEEVTDCGPWVDFLGHRERYVRLSRTLVIGDEFRVRSEFYFANPRLRVLLDFSVKSLRKLAIHSFLHFRFGLPTTKTQWVSSFETFDAALAEELEIPVGQQGQRYDVSLSTLGSEPLAFHRFWVPPNNYHMQINQLSSK